jgi:hypothetical protein
MGIGCGRHQRENNVMIMRELALTDLGRREPRLRRRQHETLVDVSGRWRPARWSSLANLRFPRFHRLGRCRLGS